jgi:hypothetical protein
MLHFAFVQKLKILIGTTKGKRLQSLFPFGQVPYFHRKCRRAKPGR